MVYIFLIIIYSIGSTETTSSRRDFLTYCLSLMRAHNSEHRDSLPVLDVTALRHIAYVLDSILFYMRSGYDPESDKVENAPWDESDENENDDAEEDLSNSNVLDTDSIEESEMLRPTLGRRHGFFQRSESTLCLGCPPPDPFNTPMADALPLADQPHLLQPNARREELFGMPKQPITIPATSSDPNSSLELPPVKLGLSTQSKTQIDYQNVVDESIGETLTLASQNSINPDIKSNEDGGNTIIVDINSTNIQMKENSLIPNEEQPSTSAGIRKIEPEVHQQSQPQTDQAYFSKRLFYVKSRKYDQSVDEIVFNVDTESMDRGDDDQPQDLSHSAISNNVQTMKMEPYSDHDELSGDSDSGDDRASGLHNVIKRPKPNNEESQDTQAGTSSSVRPPIIVTRRKVAAAIETVTANVLAKNNKTSLSECVVQAPTNESPLPYLPKSFFDESDTDDSQDHPHNVNEQRVTPHAAISDGAIENNSGPSSFAGVTANSSSTSPGKSVIVRVGPSVSYLF